MGESRTIPRSRRFSWFRTAYRCLLALCLALPCLAQELLIAFDEAHPPYMYDKGGAAQGIYPALIQAAFARLNVAVRLEPRP